MVKGWALRFLGSYDEAIAICRQACQFPDKGFLPQTHLAAALADAGQNNEARAAVEKAMQIEPALSIGYIRDRFVEIPILENFLDSLREAGLSE